MVKRDGLINDSKLTSEINKLDNKIGNKVNKINKFETNIKKLQNFDASYFISKNHFGDDGIQNYLVFAPVARFIKLVAISQNINWWKSKGLSDETIKTVNNLHPSANYVNEKLRLKLEGSCLAQTKTTYAHKSIVNIYIVYEIGATTRNSDDPKLTNSLFGAVTLVKNSDFSKIGNTGYGIGFDRGTTFSFRGDGFGYNVLIFGVDMSSLSHIDNKKKDILVLRKGLTQLF